MGRKTVSGITLILLLTSMLILHACMFEVTLVKSSATIIVPDDHERIQWAVGNASDGDTIFVKAGIYYENVVVNKSISLVGENKDTTVIDGDGTDVIHVQPASHVNITGFTIRNGYNGIVLNSSDNHKITGNDIINNSKNGIYVSYSWFNTIGMNTISGSLKGIHIGIRYIYDSGYNTINQNNLTNNRGIGIRLSHSYSNNISGNVVANNGFGIGLMDSPENILRDNNMTGNGLNFEVVSTVAQRFLSHYIQDIDTSNTVDGKPIYYYVNHHDEQVPVDAGYVAAVNSTNIIVKGLTLTRNYIGGLFAYTNDSKVESVTATNNIFGFLLVHSWRNTISKSDLNNNNVSIALQDSFNNTITGNYVTANGIYGISLEWSDNNTIYCNNFINNLNQLASYYSTNVWDNGYEGNYWANYAGEDLDEDGIGDTLLPHQGVDYCPLMNPYIEGDVNHDGVVDIFDVVLTAKAFGSTPGDSNWNPVADLNNDGVVDIFDIVLLANNFGKTT